MLSTSMAWVSIAMLTPSPILFPSLHDVWIKVDQHTDDGS